MAAEHETTGRRTLGDCMVPLSRRGKPDARQRFRKLAAQLYVRRRPTSAYSRWGKPPHGRGGWGA